jgi:hypothetical protein
MDDFFKDALVAWGDPRQVVADPNARFFGGKVSEHALVPNDGVDLGQTKYANWLAHATSGD